jgi:hypothetical protein
MPVGGRHWCRGGGAGHRGRIGVGAEAPVAEHAPVLGQRLAPRVVLPTSRVGVAGVRCGCGQACMPGPDGRAAVRSRVTREQW